MDVGGPSNAPRLDALFGGDATALRATVRGAAISEAQTVEEMQRTWQECGYLACPHTAVGLAAARHSRSQAGRGREVPVVVLGTAHPAKFGEVVEAHTGVVPELPKSLAACLDKPTEKTTLTADYAALKAYLLETAASSATA